MMIWYVPQNVPAWLIDSNVIATLRRPPKDPPASLIAITPGRLASTYPGSMQH
jgi:hypothetical protein